MGGEPVARRRSHAACRSPPRTPEITRPVMFNTTEADQNPGDASGLSLRQSLERGHLEAARAFQFQEVSDRSGRRSTGLQPRHGVHPGARRIRNACRSRSLVIRMKSDPGRFRFPTTRRSKDGRSMAATGAGPGQGEGDRHMLVVDPVNRHALRVLPGAQNGRGWTAAEASIFDLKSNKLRPTAGLRPTPPAFRSSRR